MEVIVQRALTKIAQDCPRKHNALKKACRETLAVIQGEQEARGEGQPADTEANKYVPCLLEACASNTPKLVTTALDAIVKLIDYGYIQDTELDSDDEHEYLDDDENETVQESAQLAPAPEQQSLAGAEAASAQQQQPVADGSQPPPEGIPSEQPQQSTAESTGGEGVENDSVEPPSPSAAVGRVRGQEDGQGEEGRGRVRWAPKRMFMDEVVETICDCDLETDEVQLQVIKALVHACTANTLAVHQASLLTAVKTIYTVHLSTHDPINKNTAKASLQQMVSVVFSRMEAKDAQLKQEAAAAAELEALRKSDPEKYPPPEPVEPEPEPQPEPDPEATFDVPSSMYSAVADAVGMSEVYATVPELSAEEIFARKRRYRRALRAYRRRQWESTTPQAFPSKCHEDAFVLFRALCKHSQRPDHAGPGDGLAVAPTAEEARQMESKAVSLEMLLSIVDNSGPGFRSGEKFILAVKHYLCEALLLNSTSSNRSVMELSLKIFKPMCRDFKVHLKSLIEVFITTVFLRVLESENSTFDHKRRVLEAVTTFSDTPQALVEIFLSYDCNQHTADLYSRIITALSKTSKGRVMSNVDVANNPTLLREESFLRMKGLEGLVDILQNMLRCVGNDAEEIQGRNEHLLQPNNEESKSSLDRRSSDGVGGVGDPISSHGSNGHLADIMGSNAGEQGSPDVDMMSPVSVVQEYDRKKKLAGDLGNGFVRFNLSPAKGIAYLVEKGMLVYEPSAVASFLLENCDKLDKTQIGEYLGKEIHYKDGFCVQVLHEYVDMMDFKGMRFDDAIRHYLSGFRLPGEAQKIDRMMEKFSERYCLQNPTVFPSADTAFILAFSIIMLNTDLHNPAIKEERKMTRDGFAANNRGIAAGGNLEEAFLNQIFDSIRANPISLKEDDYAREREGLVQGAATSSFPLYFATGPSVRQKREAFNKEREGIIKDTEALFRLRKKQASAAKAQALARAAETKEASANQNQTADSTAGTADSAVTGEAKQGVGGEDPSASSPDAAVVGDESVVPLARASDGMRDVVRAMFDVAWWPMLGAFSQVLEDVDHPERRDIMTEELEDIEHEMVALCIKGCRLGIRLAGLCARWAGGEGEGGIARETLVNTLAKFTLLDTVKEMRPKSIECVRALLDIALEDGNYLAESWGPVLRYISQLARLQLFASGLHTDDHFFTSDGSGSGGAGGFPSGSMHSVSSRRDSRTGGEVYNSVGSSKKSYKGGVFGSRVNATEQARDVERMNAEVVSMSVDPATIDRVFSSSHKLSTDAIKHFVTQLCAVSSQEVNHSAAATFRSKDFLGDMSQPRIFSLQKLVEVADFNMDSRGRIVWANVWGVLGEHFSALGAHSNRSVAEYAVDSLKQLALKFMYKEELRDFNFQRLFLCPFESVYVATQHKEIKVLILDCVQNLVQARSAHIRSGWKSIFHVLSLAAKDRAHGLVLSRQAWEVARRLIDENMNHLIYDFLDVTKCLLGFVESADPELAMNGLGRLRTCADHLAAGDLKILPPSLHGSISTGQAAAVADATASANEAAIAGQELVYLQLWWPLLFGLSEAMGDPRPQVRSYALKTLAEILDTHGHIFSAQTWGLLFRGVVSPVFENAIMDQSPPLSSEWPGQEEDPRDVLAAAVAAADEEAAMERAAREVEEEERAARRAAMGTGPFSRLSAALRGGGSAAGAPLLDSPKRPAPATAESSGPRGPSAAERKALEMLKVGWTSTMAEDLLDMCLNVFLKFGDATLPLLPEVLALHQRCICQESEVLARIALRSLGRFVTSMHKSFPDSSATIVRKHLNAGGQDGGAAGSEEDKEEVYSVWHCLTASLCAIMSDNLPLELLNNPLNVSPEHIPFAEPSASSAAGMNSSSSPAWMDPAKQAAPIVNASTGKRMNSYDNYTKHARSRVDVEQPPASGSTGQAAGTAISVERAESESSWGEVQSAAHAAAAATAGGTGEGGDRPNSGNIGGDATAGEESKGERDSRQSNNHAGAASTGDRGGASAASVERQQSELVDASGAEQNQVGGDVVMVSPVGHDVASDDGGEGAGGGSGQNSALESRGFGGGDVSRRPNLGALMTMLVVSLRMQRLVHWVVRKRCLDGLSEENLMDLLSALEAASVTALQFNRHHNLRRALGRVGFMTRGEPVPLCPMLEQEVAGYNLLLRTLVVLSCGMDVDTGEVVEGGAGWPFAQARLVQACKFVVLAYADREEHAMGLALSLPSLDHSALVEEVRETTALVILALRSMMYISEEEVHKNLTWMYGSMARLVRCDSDAVRQQVHEILTHKMGPGLMSRSSEQRRS